MKAVEFTEQNIVLGANQPQYIPLHAYISPLSDMTVCFELDEDEVKQLQEDQRIFIRRLTFGHRAQPMFCTTRKPKFSSSHKTVYDDYHTIKMKSEAPNKFSTVDDPVIISFELTAKDLEEIEKTKLVWITTITLGTPYQPIQTLISNPYS